MAEFFLFIFILIIALPLLLLIVGLLFIKRNISAAQKIKEQYFKNFQGGNRNYNTKNAHSNDDVIIDRRSREQAEQKIFDKNEGEYVDFTED